MCHQMAQQHEKKEKEKAKVALDSSRHSSVSFDVVTIPLNKHDWIKILINVRTITKHDELFVVVFVNNIGAITNF